MKRLINTSLILLILFSACEYEPKTENFQQLLPPEASIPFEISLNDINPSDTIYIYQNTTISIRVSSTKDLIEAKVYYDGEEYFNTRKDSLKYTIYPDRESKGMHTLRVNANFTSNTGSLAEMKGLETYDGETTWNIIVIHNPKELLKLKHQINEEGYLELSWRNGIPDKHIKAYTLYSSITQNTDTIYDIYKNKLVDYHYVCGTVRYDLTTILKDGFSFNNSLIVNATEPAILFEDLGVDSLRVYWNSPYANGRFILKVGNSTVAHNTQDTSIIVPQYYGETRSFTLETKPQKNEYDHRNNNFKTSSRFCQGVIIGLPNWELYAYNKKDNIIYSRRYESLVAFNANTLEEINSVTISGNPWGFAYGGKIACAPNKSTVAAMTGEETWIFADTEFLSPIIIPSLRGGFHTRLAALTNAD
nr:hypothetical protein [Bacteroidales bacterium]